MPIDFGEIFNGNKIRNCLIGYRKNENNDVFDYFLLMYFYQFLQIPKHNTKSCS